MAAIRLGSVPKTFTADLDKAIPPQETLARVEGALKRTGFDILAENRRVDTGRLGIPVYLAVCGTDAKKIMPTRKQMGKGSSPEQARASALMELIERHSFFSFWRDLPGTVKAGWQQAQKLFGDKLIPMEQLLASVGDKISPADAARLLDTLPWTFYEASLPATGEEVWLPLEWFRMLGEFNGSAAGNTYEEAILQAVCELVERHVSALVSENHPALPTILPETGLDPALDRLISAFTENGVNLVLKDMTLGMGIPTVGAFAWDAATFPESSELVFTAGTATSPAKAAIRAITEVAQLGGDFCTNSVYEASGLEKFQSLEEAAWLLGGETAPLSSLPNISGRDIGQEAARAIALLAPMPVYVIPTTTALGIPAVWCVTPGLKFRERDKNACIGLFCGRRMVEELDGEAARKGMELLEEIYGKRHFTAFFRGMLALNAENPEEAAEFFAEAHKLGPDREAAALAAFYAGHTLFTVGDWQGARTWLELAFREDPVMKEAANLLGVGHYRNRDYASAEAWFDTALRLDKGSAVDLANRGICRKFQGKYDLARADLENALALDMDLDFARKHLKEMDGK